MELLNDSVCQTILLYAAIVAGYSIVYAIAWLDPWLNATKRKRKEIWNRLKQERRDYLAEIRQQIKNKEQQDNG